ncbi:MAG: hypothetical protein ACR2OD_04935 [Gaiellaceae bacterium]
MPEGERHTALATLLRETAKAHHQAFAATDGEDPEWPLWYAEQLQTQLPPIVPAELTVSRLVHTLVQLDDEHGASDSDLPWPEFWATGILARFTD